MNPPLIALLTDFGSADPYAGIMKGVIAGIAPGASTVDITHAIPPGDIRRAAIVLWQAVPFFPSSTIFLAVVDPGVGTRRRPMLLQSNAGQARSPYSFIGPDNGLFSFVLSEGSRAWELRDPAYRLPQASMTFHGRDLFAPAAAHTANGIPGERFGPPIDDPVRLPLPHLARSGFASLEGEILFADHFGNLLTSLGVFHPHEEESLRFQPWLPGPRAGVFPVREAHLALPDGTRLPLAPTFGDIPNGKTAALVGSSGLLEIAANRASAAEMLPLREGDRVVLEFTRP